MTNDLTTTATEKPATCKWCGRIHDWAPVCPAVRAFEYYPNGTVKRVEFHQPDFGGRVQVPSRTAGDTRGKPLEWRDRAIPGISEAKTIAGDYQASIQSMTSGRFGAWHEGRVIGKYASPEEARAACQAHFDAAILSVIQTSPEAGR